MGIFENALTVYVPVTMISVSMILAVLREYKKKDKTNHPKQHYPPEGTNHTVVQYISTV